jgi:hypothetical protein
VGFVLIENQHLNTKVKQMNDYIYTKSGTDITLRWQKLYGYVPASEQAKYKKKWADFQALCARTLDDAEPIFRKDIVNLRFKQK